MYVYVCRQPQWQSILWEDMRRRQEHRPTFLQHFFLCLPRLCSPRRLSPVGYCAQPIAVRNIQWTALLCPAIDPKASARMVANGPPLANCCVSRRCLISCLCCNFPTSPFELARALPSVLFSNASLEHLTISLSVLPAPLYHATMQPASQADARRCMWRAGPGKK